MYKFMDLFSMKYEYYEAAVRAEIKCAAHIVTMTNAKYMQILLVIVDSLILTVKNDT